MLNMKMIAINKQSSKLKIWSVEMPNAPAGAGVSPVSSAKLTPNIYGKSGTLLD
jgi:hypothetical protein